MTNMKRCLSDSENDDLYDDDIKDGSPGQHGHMSDRKKRRGIIEKRRRDRINNSLTELRRLVPAAFEKQGSAKLEKAEILQMTVDHLKMLHSKGVNGYNLDTAALAMDYRSVGFRECAAEVARYLVAVEGMDIQDPLRMRLLSHLQCYSAQREAAAKASLTSGFQGSSWNHMTHHSMNSQYSSGAMGTMASPASMISGQHGAAGEHLSMTSHSSGLSTSSYTDSSRLSHQHTDNSHVTSSMMRLGNANHVGSHQVPTSSSMLSSLPQVHTQFPVSLGMNSVPMLSPTGTHYTSSSMMSLGQSAAVKPYRPWGAELVY